MQLFQRLDKLTVMTMSELTKIMRRLIELRIKVIQAKDSKTGKKPIHRQYAVQYFLNLTPAYQMYGIEGLRTQIIYILSNLEDWTCEEGMKTKNELKLIHIQLKEMI